MDMPPANLACSTQRHPDRAADPSHHASCSFYDDATDAYDEVRYGTPPAQWPERPRRRSYGESAG